MAFEQDSLYTGRNEYKDGHVAAMRYGTFRQSDVRGLCGRDSRRQVWLEHA